MVSTFFYGGGFRHWYFQWHGFEILPSDERNLQENQLGSKGAGTDSEHVCQTGVLLQENLEYFVMLSNDFFVEGKPRKGVTYPSTLEYSSSKSTAVKSGK